VAAKLAAQLAGKLPRSMINRKELDAEHPYAFFGFQNVRIRACTVFGHERIGGESIRVPFSTFFSLNYWYLSAAICQF
jgi:hypothetical protein